MLDVAGTTLTKEDTRRLENSLVGGVILFSRNWKNRDQLINLTNSIKEIRPDLLIAVDQEGGRVQRFRTGGFTPIPAMHAIGQQWVNDDMKKIGMGALASVETATACGYVLASELRACGVDMSFGPVLDLDWGMSEVIGDRAFSHDPRVVSLIARAVMHGMHLAGMANCGKHFPGHGFVEADSHTELPIDERRLDRILERDGLPYQTLGIALDSVMTAHVVYSAVDPVPVTYSKKWLQDVLRTELGFKGCIFSDDLSMAAARSIKGKQLDYTEATLLALAAGCDMVLLCNQSIVDNGAALDDVLKSLEKARKDGKLKSDMHSEYRRRLLLPRSEAIVWDYLMIDPRYQNSQKVIAEV
ncbi:MAG: beta-N-acetylhexosaminidase [Saezia sp.]